MRLSLNLSRFNELRMAKPGKSWLVMGIALGIGGIAAIATRSFLAHQVQAIEARANVRKIALVVAKGDLPKGAKLSTETLAVREIPAEYAHSAAITPENFDRIDGQALAYPVKSGEMILWSLLETKRAPTFSARVEEGRRALTVPVDEINSISGMVEPGDIIDLVLTLEQNGRKRAVPLLQGVQVMATGQRSVDDPRSGERRQYSTVTLNTSPQQARDLIIARESGKLTALLRNPQDQQGVGMATDVAQLFQPAPVLAAAAAMPRPRKAVPVLYGGNASNMTPDALARFAQAVQSGRPAETSAPAPVPPLVPEIR